MTSFVLKNNVERFVTELTDQNLDFQLGIVTPDVECNSPLRSCPASEVNHVAGDVAPFQSYSCCATARPLCTDQQNPAGTTYVGTDCELGRLQGNGATGQRIFSTPAAADKEQFVSDFIAAIDFALHGLEGSAYESGVQAVTLAVACSVGSPDCDDASTGNAIAAQELNKGFIRDSADLVIIFLTDEDDCSAGDPSIYRRPNDPTSPTDTATHFCDPDECYAYYNAGHDANHNGLDDWWDPATSGANFRPKCGIGHNIERTVNPPGLAALGPYLDKLASYKGDIHKVRAAGNHQRRRAAEHTTCGKPTRVIPAHRTDHRRNAAAPVVPTICRATLPPPTTKAINVSTRSATPGGPIDPLLSGCETAPAGRYVDFLNDLSDRHTTAGFEPDILTDSICRTAYDQTLDNIVNNIIIPKCFQLSATPTSADLLSVTLNGQTLPNVPVGSTQKGWSWTAGSRRNHASKADSPNQVGDRFEILQVTATQ